jgi:hypothetical protein
MADDAVQEASQAEQLLAHDLASHLVALSPRLPDGVAASSSVSSELSSSTSKAASETTASTSIAGDSEAACQTDKDESKTSEPATSTAKDATKIEVLADKPGYRKELRTSPAGNKYLIETRGLWTTLRSLTPLRKNRSTQHRLKKKLVDFATFWPFLLRFAKKVINLGRGRFLLHLVASTLTGLAPVGRPVQVASRDDQPY